MSVVPPPCQAGHAIDIRTFEGGIHPLHELIESSWSHDYADEIRFEYSEAFLRWHLEAPTTKPELCLGAYRGRKLIGFCARFPRMLTVRGETLHAALGTFLTTHAEWRGRGVARRLVECGMDRLRREGYRGYFTYLQRGHGGAAVNRHVGMAHDVVRSAIRFYVKPLDERLNERWNIGVPRTLLRALARLPDPPRHSGNVRRYEPADLEACRRLLNGIRDIVPASRQWASDELRDRLEGYPELYTFVLEEERTIKGLVHAYAIDLSGKSWGDLTTRKRRASVRAAFIDQMRLDLLDARQKRALLSRALRDVAEAGCLLALVPDFYCYDKALFLRCGFVPDFLTPPIRLDFNSLEEDWSHAFRGRIYLDWL